MLLLAPVPDVSELNTVKTVAVSDEVFDMMVFTCVSVYPEIVRECLEKSGVLTRSEKFSVNGFHVRVEFPTDMKFRAVSAWASDAFGCGLIEGLEIVR